MDDRGQTVSRRQDLEALAILAGLVLMAYANCFPAGFARDSRPLILENERVHSVTRQHVREILVHSYSWPGFSSGLYRPVSTLSYLFNFAVLDNSDQPAGYHWINCLLHVANAFLVYRLAWLMLGQYWPALFAAALWALHPVSTEAVTNIAGRPEELAALGVLAALLLYVRGKRESGGRKIPWLAALAAAAAVAVFSKESGVMVLALAALYDIAYRSRRDWKGYLCLALPALAMLVVRWVVLRHDTAMELPFVDNPLSGAPFLAGRATALGVIGRYLWLLVWPRTLSCDYSYNQIPVFAWHSMTWQQWSFLAAPLALLIVAAVCYHRHRTGFFLLGFSALTLLPTANLLVITGTIMGERLLYLPSVGFAIALTLETHALVHRMGWRPAVASTVLGALALAYGVRTYLRNPDWLDDETIFASAAEAAPASFKPHLSLADLRYRQDPTFQQGEQAIWQAEAAAEIVHGLPYSRTPTLVPLMLGRVYCARGDSLASQDADGNPRSGAASAEWYRKALEADLYAVSVDRAFDADHRRRALAHGTPADRIAVAGLPEVYANLGRVYLRLSDPQRALEAFLQQRRVAPAMADAYLNISSADVALNRAGDATVALLEAYTFDDSVSTLYRLLGRYRTTASGACAAVSGAAGQSLNPDCEVVRRDLCGAYRDLEQAFQDAKQFDMVKRFQDARGRVPGCQ